MLNMIPKDHQKRFVLQDSSWSVKTTGQDLATVEKTHHQMAKNVNKIYEQLRVQSDFKMPVGNTGSKGDQVCFLNGVRKLWLAMLLLFKLNVAMSAEAASAVPMLLLLEMIESSCDEAFRILFEANLTAQLTVIASTAPGISPSYISLVIKFPDSVESKKQAIHDEVDRHLKREEIEERKVQSPLRKQCGQCLHKSREEEYPSLHKP